VNGTGLIVMKVSKKIKEKAKDALPDKLSVMVKHPPVEILLEWEKQQRRRKEDLPGHVREAERD